MIESMLRDGADEETVVRALRATAGSRERTRGSLPSLRGIVRYIARWSARGAAA
jgi:hypothetical protein